MAKVLQIMGGNDNNHTFGQTRYFTIANTDFDGTSMSTAEAASQITCRSAGTFSNLKAYVSTYTQNGGTLIRFRKNGANGDQMLFLNGTGWFEDLYHSDVVEAGDKYNGLWDSTGSSSGLIAVQSLQIDFRANKNTVSRHALRIRSTLLNSLATLYHVPAGTFSGANTVDTHALTIVGTAGTVKNLQVNITQINTTDGTIDIRTHIDTGAGGGAGNCLVTVPAGTTGIFEDLTNTDTLNVGDKICYSSLHNGSSGNYSLDVISFEFETTNNKFMSFAGRANATVTQAIDLTRYRKISGYDTALEATEANTQNRISFPVRVTYMTLRISSNNNDENGTITLRKNGAATAVTTTVTASTPDTYTDNTNSADFTYNDLISIESVTNGTTGFWSFRHWAVTLENLGDRRVSPGQVR